VALQTIVFFEKAVQYDFRISKRLAVCAAISVVCLVILLVAFAISQETNFVLGKSIFIHAFFLMITFGGFISNFLSLITVGSTLCYLVGKRYKNTKNTNH
jgi:hypothetical protein